MKLIPVIDELALRKFIEDTAIDQGVRLYYSEISIAANRFVKISLNIQEILDDAMSAHWSGHLPRESNSKSTLTRIFTLIFSNTPEYLSSEEIEFYEFQKSVKSVENYSYSTEHPDILSSIEKSINIVLDWIDKYGRTKMSDEQRAREIRNLTVLRAKNIVRDVVISPGFCARLKFDKNLLGIKYL